MNLASKSKLNELKEKEDAYWNTVGVFARETERSMLRAKLVKDFVKTTEMVDELIEKLDLEIEKVKKEKNKVKKEKEELPAGVIRAKFSGWDADTGEKINIGDLIVKTYQGWSKVDNAF